VSNPQNPQEIGYYDTGDYARGVYVVDTLAYVSDGYDGLRVIDVSNPAIPNEVGYYDTGGYAFGVYVLDTLTYVIDGNDGLYIIKYTGDNGIKDKIKYSENINVTIINSSINIKYSIKSEKKVNIKIYDILGRNVVELARDVQGSGEHIFRWTGKRGVYFIRVQIGSDIYTKRAIIIK